jgi:hypothetical protein
MLRINGAKVPVALLFKIRPFVPAFYFFSFEVPPGGYGAFVATNWQVN